MFRKSISEEAKMIVNKLLTEDGPTGLIISIGSSRNIDLVELIEKQLKDHAAMNPNDAELANEILSEIIEQREENEINHYLHASPVCICKII